MIPFWQRDLIKVFLPLFKQFMVRALRLSPNHAERALAKTKAIHQELEEYFKDGRKYVLGTDEPTYCDFALASLSGSMYLHPKYGGM